MASSGEEKSKKNTNGGGLDNKIECFMEVNARALVKSLGDKTSFVAKDGVIRVAFDAKNLFAVDKISMGGKMN